MNKIEKTHTVFSNSIKMTNYSSDICELIEKLKTNGNIIEIPYLSNITNPRNQKAYDKDLKSGLIKNIMEWFYELSQNTEIILLENAVKGLRSSKVQACIENCINTNNTKKKAHVEFKKDLAELLLELIRVNTVGETTLQKRFGEWLLLFEIMTGSD
jgi:hypothetical protein